MDNSQDNNGDASKLGEAGADPSVMRPATMDAGVISEFHGRITALENDNAALRATLENARQTGAVPYPGFVEHVAHVMGKYYHHEKPDGFDKKYPLDPSRDGGG